MKRKSAASLERGLRSRRDSALARHELRESSAPREAPAGATSFPVKARDPETDRLVAEFLGKSKMRPRTKPRSPIDLAIDCATGHVDSGMEDVTITLRCPSCRTEKKDATSFECDPPGTVLVELPCENCPESPPRFFDASGFELKAIR